MLDWMPEARAITAGEQLEAVEFAATEEGEADLEFWREVRKEREMEGVSRKMAGLAAAMEDRSGRTRISCILAENNRE
jgi:hypothetical protein